MAKKVALMVGHGKTTAGTWDSGCAYAGYTEAALMLPITKAAVKYLRNSGVTVISDADTNNNRSMVVDVAWANREKVDIYVSVHCDWYKAPTGVYPLYVSSRGKKLADALNSAVKAGMPMKSRGVCRRTDLYELNATDAPACILETGSIKADIKTLKNYDKYGKLIAKGICNYFGIKLKELAEPVKAPVAKAPEPELYRVRKTWADAKSQVGTYKILANAKKVADEKGLSVFDSKGKAVYTGKKKEVAKSEPKPKKAPTVTIGHACSDYDGKAGDSSGKEVTKSAFKYSSSATSAYNWTYVFRPKDSAKAEKAASMCEKAIANNNIGYNKKGETAYGKDRAMSKLAKAAKYDLSKIKVKCGLSCGDLICLCNRYAGLSTCYIGRGLLLANSLKKNANFTCIPYKAGVELKRGDVLITAHSNGKYNHVVMVLVGNAKTETKPVPKAVAATPTKSSQIRDKAKSYALPSKDEAVYNKDKPKENFKKDAQKLYGSKISLSDCQVFAGTVISGSGFPKMPVDNWANIFSYLKKNFTSIKVNYTESQLKEGDIRIYQNDKGGYHIWIITGKAQKCEGNHCRYYPHFAKNDAAKKHKNDWLFRAK